MCSRYYLKSKYSWKKNCFKGSKICWLKDFVDFGNQPYLSKFGEIFPSVSRLPGYESVVRGAVHHTGQKVILLSTNFRGY